MTAGQLKLFVRPLDREEIRALPGTEGGNRPFFSPDGHWVGFFAEKKLKKVALAGGSPITLCDAPNHRQGSWGPDGTIVLAASTRAGLQSIPASGGEPKVVTTPNAEKLEKHVFPQILPGGETVLFQLVYGGGRVRAAAVSLRSGEQKNILEDATYPRYLPTGHLVFTRGGVLFAAPFNSRRLETTGPAVPFLEDLLTNRYTTDFAEFAFSQEGTLVYVPIRQIRREIVWVDRKGAAERTSFPSSAYQWVALTSDGQRLAVTSIGNAETESLSFGDFVRGTLTRSVAGGRTRYSKGITWITT